MKDKVSGKDFSVPDGYFESFTERLLSKIEHRDMQPNIDGFTVPAGYFETVQDQILEKLSPPKTKIVPLRSNKIYYYAMAGIAAAVLLIFGLYINQDKEISFSFDDLAYSEIETYFESNSLSFTSYEIAELIPVDQLEINDILVEHLNQEHIIEYLTNTIDSPYELNLEYDE